MEGVCFLVPWIGTRIMGIKAIEGIRITQRHEAPPKTALFTGCHIPDRAGAVICMAIHRAGLVFDDLPRLLITTPLTVAGMIGRDAQLEILVDAGPAGRRLTMLALTGIRLSLIHISEPTRQAEISYAVFC